MSCFVQYAPYHLKEGNWDEQREAFGDAVIDALAESTRRTSRNIILHRQVLTPLDIERVFGLTEGNIFQGELTLEQLFFLRPAPGWAQYRTPIRGLYMCGSATHPGGGIMGAPGKNAAGVLLADMKGGAREYARQTAARVSKHDLIVVGAGPNGLIAAALLAKAGFRPLVLERRDVVGGTAVTEEFHPGFRASMIAARPGRFFPGSWPTSISRATASIPSGRPCGCSRPPRTDGR